MDIQALNEEFGIDGIVSVIEGEGGFPLIRVKSDKAEALVSIYGGQALGYKPKGAADDLLFLSDKAYYAEGKAIKGGIPVCWPWFGADPEGKGRPGHGFVRNRMWDLRATTIEENGDVRIIMGLQDNEETWAIWPHSFDLLIEFAIGDELTVLLVTANMGDAPFSLSQALHSYYRVGDISRTEVLGLDGKPYLDKAKGASSEPQQQAGAVTVSAEVDRIYLETDGSCAIEDEALGRSIRIDSENSGSTVVWNPWSEIAASMGDLQDDDYHRFLCVETANADSDTREVPPGGVFTLKAVISTA